MSPSSAGTRLQPHSPALRWFMAHCGQMSSSDTSGHTTSWLKSTSGTMRSCDHQKGSSGCREGSLRPSSLLAA